ncbi:cytochrome P450 [Halobacteriales archaeon QS_1_68_20]|nr:MAG: cytochrome P450 [Halobacteriales archaeon QS_1_68_20]
MSHAPVPEALSEPDTRLNPFPWFAEMRESDPVRYDPDREVWDVFTYEQTREILNDHGTYSSSVMGEEVGPLARSMTFSDPPRHDFLRAAAAEYFQPGAVDASTVREAAVERIERDLDAGELDVMDDLAFPVALVALAELLGVPADDRDTFLEYAWGGLRGQTPAGDPVDDPVAYLGNLVEYFWDLVERRREQRGDGFVSHMLDVEVDGRTPTDEDVVANCDMMKVGATSTAHLLTNAVYCFAQVDGLASELAGDESALERAIEETLRYRSPTLALPRVATTDAELAGREIAAGDGVVAWVASANRDPAVFDDPDSFTYDEQPDDHLAFGEGIHYCIGTYTARMEARVVLSELLDRVDRMRVREDDVEVYVTPVEFGFESLPLSVGPASE